MYTNYIILYIFYTIVQAHRSLRHPTQTGIQQSYDNHI